MKLTISGSLCDLNTYISVERSNRFMAAKIKKEETELVYWACKEQKLKPYRGKITEIIFSWYCKNKKKDPDNISSFGRKVILDGMVLAKVLKSDGWNTIEGFADRFYIDKHERVEIEII